MVLTDLVSPQLLLITMGALGQCIEILDLTSFHWGKSRTAVVAHSFRVMSRSRNYDEMVVGIMHHVYASSSYARGLFNCDVYDNTLWKEALDLFVERKRKMKAKVSENLPDEVLLGLNRDQDIAAESVRLEEWMAQECRWSSKYRRRIERIGTNRIARNVMLYDLEDKLEILTHPERFQEERSEEIALPWKKEYVADLYVGRHSVAHTAIPDTDDNILLRPLTKSERADLADKYSRAISLLTRMECADGPREGDFPAETVIEVPEICKKWYGQWYAHETSLEEMGEETEL